MTEQEQKAFEQMREALEKLLRSMEHVVQFRETGLGRPPEQTCLFEIAEARQALAAANAVSHPQATEPAWRPIESAPKEERSGAEPIRILLGWLQTEYCAISPKEGYWANGEWISGILPARRPPTHWMPLPAAPEAKQ